MTATVDAAAVLWSAAPAERAGRPLLVLLHGYGSNERDLFGLVPHLPERLVVASLRAIGANAAGYEWFPLGPELAGPAGHVPSEHADRLRADGTNQAAQAVRAWLDAVAGPFSAVALAGFSQGGAVAAQVLRQEPGRADAVAILSGFVAPGAADGDVDLAARRPPVLWACGDADPVIAPYLLERTAAWLPAHTTLTARSYPGLGHAISADTLADLGAFLEKHLG
ncbi:alpha/beta hydrolase [Georgenia sp.]